MNNEMSLASQIKLPWALEKWPWVLVYIRVFKWTILYWSFILKIKYFSKKLPCTATSLSLGKGAGKLKEKTILSLQGPIQSYNRNKPIFSLVWLTHHSAKHHLNITYGYFKVPNHFLSFSSATTSSGSIQRTGGIWHLPEGFAETSWQA